MAAATDKKDETADAKAAKKDAQKKAPKGFKVAEGEGYDSPPDRDGRPDEVVGRYRWDVASNDWVDHRGVDHTEKENIPHGFEHLGDGSEANPHRVVPRSRW